MKYLFANLWAEKWKTPEPFISLIALIVALMAVWLGSLPFYLSLFVLAFVSIYLLYQLIKGSSGILIPLYWLVFALPFIELINYVGFDYSGVKPSMFWGLVTNPYTFDEEVIELVATMGAVGGCAFLIGKYIANQVASMRNQQRIVSPASVRRLPVSSTLIICILVGVLFWLNAPNETVFQSPYPLSPSPLAGYGFDSAGLVASGLWLLAFADALMDVRNRVKRIKLTILIPLLAFCLLYFQLFRGDRDGMSVVVAAVLMATYWRWQGKKNRLSLSALALVPTLVILFIVGQFIGGLRSTVATPNTEPSSLIGNEIPADFEVPDLAVVTDDLAFLHGTWSAVLWTPLSAAGDSLRANLEPRFGSDYRDLLLSSPPGFIAKLVNYERPVDSTRGPAFRLTYAGGGIHAVVLPFLNFGLGGILLIIPIWVLALGYLESLNSRYKSTMTLVGTGLAFSIAPLWMWYGDKLVLTSLGVFLGLFITFRVLSRTTGKAQSSSFIGN